MSSWIVALLAAKKTEQEETKIVCDGSCKLFAVHQPLVFFSSVFSLHFFHTSSAKLYSDYWHLCYWQTLLADGETVPNLGWCYHAAQMVCLQCDGIQNVL